MEGLTVKKLLQFCQAEISKGNGEKVVLITNDDECNGFHTLYSGFIADEEKDIEKLKKYCDFHDANESKAVVLLG